MNTKRILVSISIVFAILLFSFCSKSNVEEELEEEIIVAKPIITSLSPSKGVEGDPVTITGVNFSSDASLIKVRFDDTDADNVTFSSNNQISTIVPADASTGKVTVTVGSNTVISAMDFTVEKKPIINSISSSSGLVGTSVVINGVNFNSDISTFSVRFNGVKVEEITAASNTEITVVVPAGAYSGPVSIVFPSQTTIGPNFVVETPENFKMAFLADSHIGSGAKAVLNLIKIEAAEVVVHPGDLNYDEIPIDFENHINGILGADFPYFYCVGNHDDEVWNGATGYQSLLEDRFQRLGISWQGQLGVLSSFAYQGIRFVSSAPDEFDVSTQDAGNYIRSMFKENSAKWNVSFWHKNQRLMQIGGKSDEAGWHVYEESRKAGAIMATGHEHSYSRTHEMRNFQTQFVSSTDNIVNLLKDDPSTFSVDEGRSFAFVSGLGGNSIREPESDLDLNPWWANVYHNNNGGQHGALFGVFNYDGDATLAYFYFKDIDGVVRDEFFVRSNN